MKINNIILFIIINFLATSCEKEIYMGITESFPTSFGKVYISTNPQGYKVYVDDKYWESLTPDTIKWIVEGSHKITLKHDLYIDTSFTIKVNGNTSQTFLVDVIKNPRFFSQVSCSTIPAGARISINDNLTNYVTPSIIKNIFPGYIKFKFLKDNFRDDSLTIKVKGGTTTEINRPLEDTSRTVSYRMNNSKISSNLLSKVIVDKFNNKWVGSIDHGLMKFDGKNWISYESLGIFKSKRIQDLLFDSRERLWIATSDGLVMYDGINWISFDDKLSSVDTRSVVEDSNGNIWIATAKGLTKYDNLTFKIFTQNNTDMPLTNLSVMASAPNGDVWIGTNTFGIIRYSNGKWSQYLTSQKPNLEEVSNIIKAIVVDKNNIVWIYHAESPYEGYASSFTKLTGGMVWVFKQIPLQFPLDVYQFFVDDQNNIWIAINGGLIKYKEDVTYIYYDYLSYGYFSKQCVSFIIDKAGVGWLATQGGGLCKLKKGTF